MALHFKPASLFLGKHLSLSELAMTPQKRAQTSEQQKCCKSWPCHQQSSGWEPGQQLSAVCTALAGVISHWFLWAIKLTQALRRKRGEKTTWKKLILWIWISDQHGAVIVHSFYQRGICIYYFWPENGLYCPNFLHLFSFTGLNDQDSKAKL